MKRHYFILFFLSLFLSACVDVDLTNGTKAYKVIEPEVSKLYVKVHPKSPSYQPEVKALLYPMHILQGMRDKKGFAASMTEVMADVWTKNEVFTHLTYDRSLEQYSPHYAIAQAKSEGADLVILPRVPYLYLGNNLDDTAITIQVDIYETFSGKKVFSMEQAVRIQPKHAKSWIFYEQNYILPDAPLATCIQIITENMSKELSAWLQWKDVNKSKMKTPDTTVTRPVEILVPMSIPEEKVNPTMVPPIPNETKAAEGVPFSFFQDIIFSPDSSTLSQDGAYGLGVFTKRVLALYGVRKEIVINQYLDEAEDADWQIDLAAERSRVIMEYLYKEYGIKEEYIKTRIHTSQRLGQQKILPTTVRLTGLNFK